jgi:hypothetical protein
MTVNSFIRKIVKSIILKNGCLFTPNYSLGQYTQDLDDCGYAVITKISGGVNGGVDFFRDFPSAFEHLKARVTSQELTAAIDSAISKLEDYGKI